jgi:Kef-type K+ transport system membrane component KefB
MMPEISFVGVLIVAAVAFGVPLALGVVPALRVPSVVEIVAGIVIGPAVLGLVEVDAPLRFMALLGLAFLLFLAGTEIDLGGLLRGGALRSAGAGFALSLAIAFAVASLLGIVGLIQAPLLVAIMLSATSLGIVVPVLADAGQSRSALGNWSSRARRSRISAP